MTAPASASQRGLIQTLAGSVLGGVAGYFAFVWIASQGLYALVVPGAALGLGAGLAARRNSQTNAIVCGIAGLALGLFCEWKIAPFVADDSLGYFVTHLHRLKPMTLILAGLGAFVAYRFALGTRSPSSSNKNKPGDPPPNIKV